MHAAVHHPAVHAMMHHPVMHAAVHHPVFPRSHPNVRHGVGGRDGTGHGGGGRSRLDEGGTAEGGQNGEGEGQFPHEETPVL